MHFKYDKQSLWNQRGPGNDLYHCFYHSVVHVTMTCPNAKDNLYFVIIFLQLLSYVVYDTVEQMKTMIAFQKNIT